MDQHLLRYVMLLPLTARMLNSGIPYLPDQNIKLLLLDFYDLIVMVIESQFGSHLPNLPYVPIGSWRFCGLSVHNGMFAEWVIQQSVQPPS